MKKPFCPNLHGRAQFARNWSQHEVLKHFGRGKKTGMANILVHSRYRTSVYHWNDIEFTIVDTKAQVAVFLRQKNDKQRPLSWGGLWNAFLHEFVYFVSPCLSPTALVRWWYECAGFFHDKLVPCFVTDVWTRCLSLTFVRFGNSLQIVVI